MLPNFLYSSVWKDERYAFLALVCYGLFISWSESLLLATSFYLVNRNTDVHASLKNESLLLFLFESKFLKR